MVRRAISEKQNKGDKGKISIALVLKQTVSAKQNKSHTDIKLSFKDGRTDHLCKAAGKLKLPSIIPDTGQANNWHLGRTDPCSNSYWCVVDGGVKDRRW